MLSWWKGNEEKKESYRSRFKLCETSFLYVIFHSEADALFWDTQGAAEVEDVHRWL